MAKSLYCRHNLIFLDMLRVLRERKQLRQADLAKMVGHSQATVSKVESGERRLDVIELRAWLAALDTEFTDFVGSLDAELRLKSMTDTVLLSDVALWPQTRSPP